MIGPGLLAAPVTADRSEADGEGGQPTPVSVYLPAGRWVNVFTGQAYSGGQTVVDPAGLDEFPLYLRAGAAIGFNARTPDVWSDGWGPDDLAKPGLAGWLYAPGGPGGPAAQPLGGPASRAISSGRRGMVVTVWPPYGLRCHNHALHRGARSLACGSRGAGVTGGAGSAGAQARPAAAGPAAAPAICHVPSLITRAVDPSVYVRSSWAMSRGSFQPGRVPQPKPSAVVAAK